MLLALCLLSSIAPQDGEIVFPATQVEAPAPVGALPSAAQLAWHEREVCAFVHFNMNTFTDEEWGHGRAPATTFAPTELDTSQWVKVAQDAGLNGIVLTAKHHDGFCLWPSELTDYDVASSAWKDGKGDVLRELADACAEAEFDMGLYLSPWDRNHPSYGDSPAYNAYFVGQLGEILQNYGDVFEVWFDGACGEGPTGKRQEYDWRAFANAVKQHQPESVIFHGLHPDLRWTGNERGFAGEPNWNAYRMSRYFVGSEEQPQELQVGFPDGDRWVPAECPVSIRPGWYYHADQDERVKGLDELEDIYYGSVGRGAGLLLNLPVDRRGIVHERDAERLAEFGDLIEKTFDENLAKGAGALASSVHGSDSRFGPARALDGVAETYWAAAAVDEQPWIELLLASPQTFDVIDLAEPLALGQRVASFRVEAREGDHWREIANGTTIGHRRLLRVPSVTTDAVRVTLLESLAAPILRRVALYASPPRVAITPDVRAFLGSVEVTLTASLEAAEVRYTLDGTTPNKSSMLYEGPLPLEQSTELRAMAFAEKNPGLVEARAEFEVMQSADLIPAIAFVRAPDAGLKVDVYEDGWQTLDQLAGRTPSSSAVAAVPSVRSATREEHVALVFQGLLQVPADGVYSFWLTSDDGSRMWLAEKDLVDNDGLHGSVTATGQLGLRQGWHRLRLEWFNAVGGRELSLEWAGPGFARRGIVAADLAH
ncbi:MAG: alpha-L-fucosidase [Planctomycetota bacterium]|jgi:alpha-L-fucosidase